MDERNRLYQKLQRQVNSIMPFIERVEKDSKKVKIGNTELPNEAFSKMENAFYEILNSKDEGIIKNLQTNFIPLSLVNTNVFFREIQITLNEIHQKKMEALYKDDEER